MPLRPPHSPMQDKEISMVDTSFNRGRRLCYYNQGSWQCQFNSRRISVESIEKALHDSVLEPNQLHFSTLFISKDFVIVNGSHNANDYASKLPFSSFPDLKYGFIGAWARL